jgi:hypothetical protein
VPPPNVPKCKGCGQYIGCTPEERKSIEDRGFCTERCLREYTIRCMEDRRKKEQDFYDN